MTFLQICDIMQTRKYKNKETDRRVLLEPGMERCDSTFLRLPRIYL